MSVIYNEEIEDIPRLERPERPILYVSRAISMLSYHGRFVVGGRNIFEIDSTLTQMLRDTDIGQVPLEQIHFPYETFYIHLGKQNSMDLGNGNYCDGAYISYSGSQDDESILEISLTTIRDISYERSLNFVLQPEKYFYCSLKFGPTASFQEAFNQFAQEEAKGREARHKLDGSVRSVEVDGEAMLIQDVSSLTATQEWMEFQQALPGALPALRAIVNTLCFIGSRPDDIQIGYAESAPLDLVEAARSPSVKVKQKAEQSLNRLGYTRIKFCGRHLSAHRTEEEGNCSLTGEQPHLTKEVRPRRGHWRTQPVGPRDAEERSAKLIWIMPTTTLVRVAIGKESDGHIYEVSKN